MIHRGRPASSRRVANRAGPEGGGGLKVEALPSRRVQLGFKMLKTGWKSVLALFLAMQIGASAPDAVEPAAPYRECAASALVRSSSADLDRGRARTILAERCRAERKAAIEQLEREMAAQAWRLPVLLSREERRAIARSALGSWDMATILREMQARGIAPPLPVLVTPAVPEG